MDLINEILFVLFLFQQLEISKQSLFLKPCKEANTDCRHSLTGLICSNKENRCNCPDGSKVYGYGNYPRIGIWNEANKNCYLKVGSSCELQKKYDNSKYFKYECDPDAKAKCYPLSKDKEEELGICSRTDPNNSAFRCINQFWMLSISAFIAAIQLQA